MATVQVMLLEDVPKLGKIGDRRFVAPGFARNYLLPNGLAVRATEERLGDVNFQRQLEKRRDESERQEAERLVGLFQAATITIAVRVGDQGRMHGQVTNQDVARALDEQLGAEVDRHAIQIDSPIRSLGRYLLPVRVAAGTEGSVTLEVVEHVEEPAEPEPEEPVESEAREQLPEAADDAADAADASDRVPEAEPSEAPAIGEDTDRD